MNTEEHSCRCQRQPRAGRGWGTNHGPALGRAGGRTWREWAQLACPREEAGRNIFCHGQEVLDEVGYELVLQLRVVWVCYQRFSSVGALRCAPRWQACLSDVL